MLTRKNITNYLSNITRIITKSSTAEKVAENWHEDFIMSLAKIMRPNLYLELGLYQCELFNKIIPYADVLIGIDINSDAGKFMLKTGKARFVNTSTDEYAKKLLRKPLSIDMLFIDANHSAKAVEKDFYNYFPFVSPHGLIIFHDTHPKNYDYINPGYCGDCYKTIRKLSYQTKDYEMVTIPVHPGLTICRKRKSQLKWQEKSKFK